MLLIVIDPMLGTCSIHAATMQTSRQEFVALTAGSNAEQSGAPE